MKREYKWLITLFPGKRLTAEKPKWQTRLKELKNLESQCKTYREMIDSESKFQKENASILSWITKSDQKRDHELLRERLGIDSVYCYCGKWLFDDARYSDWKRGRAVSQPVLWLKGTGKRI